MSLNEQQREQLKKAREELCNAQALYSPLLEEQAADYKQLGRLIADVEEMLGYIW
jgi:hypothetical protein